MSLPKITLTQANGQLLTDVGAIDGVAALVGTGTTAGLLNQPKTVYNLADAIAQGYTEAAEPEMYRHLKEFYAEVAANKELKIMIVPNTVTLTQMLDNTNTTNGARLLIQAFGGVVSLLAVYRKPAGGYNGGANMIDSDVGTAITNAKTFGDARLAENAPLRIIIEGRVQNAAAANTLTPKTSSNGWAGVLLGGTLTDGSASVGMLLGRAIRYAAHIKVGKVANGATSATAAYIGNTAVEKVAALGTLADAGFITFTTYPGKSGYYFTQDNMCSTDDYRLLALGRVVDKAARVAVAVLTDEIESEIAIDEKGLIASHEAAYLETRLAQQLQVVMGGQMSGVPVVTIDRTTNIVSTSKLKVKLRIRPLGYATFIDVELGFTATS